MGFSREGTRRNANKRRQRHQMVFETNPNEKFLQGGPGGQFLQKAPPLAAGGK
jgi:hypothetical protein